MIYIKNSFEIIQEYILNNTEYYKNKINIYIPELLSFYSVNNFLIDLFLSTLFVILLINKYLRKNNKNLNNISIKLDTYLDKGSVEFKNMDKKELTENVLKNLKNFSIKEVTPSGNVILSYDYDLSSFIYYSDADIPYKYLEVVSRLFVIKYDCTILYIDYKEQLFKARDIFFQKQKNKVDNQQINSIYTINRNKKLPANSNIYISPEISNKYIKKGKIKDLDEERRKIEREKKKAEIIKNISFKDFKRL